MKRLAIILAVALLLSACEGRTGSSLPAPQQQPNETASNETLQPSDVPQGTAAPPPDPSGPSPFGDPPGPPPGGFGGSHEVTQGESANTLDADGEYSEQTYVSENGDENALRIDGASVVLRRVAVTKPAGESSNTEDGDFYGMNAALLVTDGAEAVIEDSTISSSVTNGNGVFSYGENTVVTISNSQITTTGSHSGGLQTTGSGTTLASNLMVETFGNSAAAIRSDRGGGTVRVDGGSYISNGYNSPAIYSTADISVNNSTLTANNSEALVIEGKNSISLENCTVTGNMSDTKGSSSDENVHAVMIYQSMSGDANVGTSSFSMRGGTLRGRNGDLFHLTNTAATMSLSGVELVNEDPDGLLLSVTGNDASHGWGKAGANGATLEFTADGQVLKGDIVVDSISSLHMTLTGGSMFTGSINVIDNEQGGKAVKDNVQLTIASGATWTLTSDCTLSALTNKGTIDYNGFTITLNSGEVLTGDL